MPEVDFGYATLAVLALVGFLRTVVPATFAGARLCVKEYYEFRVYLRELRTQSGGSQTREP